MFREGVSMHAPEAYVGLQFLFRRGINGEMAGSCEDAAIGSGWVEMVGNISMVSVANNDQVFAIGAADRALYFRSGVTNTDIHWQEMATNSTTYANKPYL
ncbi:Tectonin beta-propeller repeat-containing protein [Eumeta japonica]|uniref:Tectonin beta-propeller repeat-containing protein n=1 Tax=Eumeta variegata TaxID=151549 RepID=A0A4C1T685_EUMVA|nr:Tectonin beta-propeller repeat-containing protein [Eumeta japonica]